MSEGIVVRVAHFDEPVVGVGNSLRSDDKPLSLVRRLVNNFLALAQRVTDHLDSPDPRSPRERLWQVELVPFVAAARAGLASVMTAHIRFEAFDRLPATLSPEAMKLLRKDVEFRGACISDDLEMKAIADTYGVADGAELAIAAGVDAVLVCHTLKLQHDAIESIARSANAGPLARERLAEAAARMEKLLQFARPASSVEPSRAAARCGTKEHRDFVARLMAPPAVAAQSDPTEWRRA